jgi:hypothetical protein
MWDSIACLGPMSPKTHDQSDHSDRVLRITGESVACGAGFEPATFGLRAHIAIGRDRRSSVDFDATRGHYPEHFTLLAGPNHRPTVNARSS